MSFTKSLLDGLNPFSKKGPVPTSDVSRGMSSKYLTSLIGTPGAGKTVTSNLAFYTARTLQQQLPGFFCSIDDTNSRIKQDIADMEGGHFPPKTRAYNTYAYQAALNMWWGKNSLFGQKSATFAVCDLAGEDQLITSQYASQPGPQAYSQAAKLVEYIYRSQILILAAPASRAPVFDNDTSVEYEEADVKFNPDVRLSDIFDQLIKKRKQQNRPFKGVILVLTKVDMVDKYVEEKWGWDLYENEGHMRAFLNKYFPWTTMSLKTLTDTWSQTEVMILPMFVETKKNSDGTQKKWPDGTPIIDVKDRTIKYNSKGMVNMINFIGRLV